MRPDPTTLEGPACLWLLLGFFQSGSDTPIGSKYYRSIFLRRCPKQLNRRFVRACLVEPLDPQTLKFNRFFAGLRVQKPNTRTLRPLNLQKNLQAGAGSALPTCRSRGWREPNPSNP